MISKRITRSLLVVEIALLLLVTTLTFLPNLRKATIYRDDWYYMVDRMKGGPDTFFEMFKIDRPARAYFFEAYYQLFGVEPAPYHLVTFGWRLLLALATYWLCSLLWPNQRRVALLITLLFIIYPGYTRWMEGIEDQPKVVSLLLQVVSYALTILAIRRQRVLPRVALWSGSILAGWGYLALVDYAMGMEVFRFLCVLVIINREVHFKTLVQKGIAAARVAAPGLLVLGGYLFWRVFLFHNERPETDIKLQLSKVVDSPADGLTSWFIHLVQSIVNNAVIAWSGYAFQDFFKLSSPQIMFGLLTALVITTCVLLGLIWLGKIDQQAGERQMVSTIPWQYEAIWIGLPGVVAGVVPVVMANRSVEFGILSHYGLPASLASSVFLVGMIYLIASQRLRLAVISVVVLLASITQYSTSTKQANEEQILNTFWHQLAWRAPGIRGAISLLANYPSVTIGEDVDFVHGPANFIYYPEPVDELPMRYALFAIKQYPWTVKEFLAGGKIRDGYRTHYGIIDYGYVLAITQPTVDSCVHVIDQRWPWFSFDDPDSILVVGQHSNIRNVLTDVAPPQLSPTVFGPEPVHAWCYYFEKADLALQQEDWQTVSTLGDQVAQYQLNPAEPLEWMPFLQTYAILGDEEKFTTMLSRINRNAYNRGQLCNVMTGMIQAGYTFPPEIQRQVDQNLCVDPVE